MDSLILSYPFINEKHLFERALGALQKILPSVDFFLHHGDICYAHDTPFDLFKTYEEAFDYCHPVLNKLCSSVHKNQIPYSNQFHMPSKQSGGYLSS